MIFMAFSRKVLISASHCLLSDGGARDSSTRTSALRKGWVKMNLPIAIRWRAWTTMKIVSSGWRNSFENRDRRADAEQILRRRIILRGIALRHQAR